MKFGYILMHFPETPKPASRWSCFRWPWLPIVAPPPPPLYTTICIGEQTHYLQLTCGSNITTVPYAKSRETTFPRRILFHDTCLMAEHYDPYTHNNCDPILAKMLGDHPEFQVCLSSPYNGSYISAVAEPEPLFSMCRVKNVPNTMHKYIFAYDDRMVSAYDLFAILKQIIQ